nr:hypothetical protein [Brevundimonas diminuta]
MAHQHRLLEIRAQGRQLRQHLRRQPRQQGRAARLRRLALRSRREGVGGHAISHARQADARRHHRLHPRLGRAPQQSSGHLGGRIKEGLPLQQHQNRPTAGRPFALRRRHPHVHGGGAIDSGQADGVGLGRVGSRVLLGRVCRGGRGQRHTATLAYLAIDMYCDAFSEWSS